MGLSIRARIEMMQLAHLLTLAEVFNIPVFQALLEDEDIGDVISHAAREGYDYQKVRRARQRAEEIWNAAQEAHMGSPYGDAESDRGERRPH